MVRGGMTRAEVEKVLGPPSWKPPPTDDLVMVTADGKKLVTSLRWRQDGQEAVLHFDVCLRRRYNGGSPRPIEQN